MKINLSKQREELLYFLCNKYKLSEEEHQRLGKNIKDSMLKGKKTQYNPIAIINIAPPGSGKGCLNKMGLSQFKDNNAVIINSDELKEFHPNADIIAHKYPQYYTKITNIDSNLWTDELFEEVVKQNYNLIFEGTGRNLKLLEKMIEKMSKYKVIVRGMAVNELNCLMSIIERYETQIKEKNWGRIVTVEHFYKAYEEMLNTIQKIETLNIVDIVEVYTRATKRDSNPIRIYSSKNKEFPDVKTAILEGRRRDLKTATKYFEENFSKNFMKNKKYVEESEILTKINNLYSYHEHEI